MSGRCVIGIVQPSYLPWLPFFERWAASDVFVLLDDVEYSKNSFFNRNAVKTAQGRRLLTVPTLYRGHSTARLDEIEINRTVPWARKHWATLVQAYSRAPHWHRYAEELGELFAGFATSRRLIEVALPLIRLLGRDLRIEAPLYRSSELGVAGQGDARLIEICRSLGGTHFLVKPGTEHYHPHGPFLAQGILPLPLAYSRFDYPQLHGEFVGGLSALDYLLNCGAGHPPFAAGRPAPALAL